MLLELIEKQLFEKHNKNEVKGLFITAFDAKGFVLASNGVINTDKTLENIVQTLYHGIIEKHSNTKVVVCDIVTQHWEETDPDKLFGYSPKDVGVFVSSLDNTNSGVILPNTHGVSDIRHALFLIKQKYGLDGNVNIVVFKTDRLSIRI